MTEVVVTTRLLEL